ncbi:hypothetical protein GCM10010168_79020 [Actinoplanes ianthinogenes]|uniref:Peptidase M48 domain-containing protein n=2 Tax=Actinoplanes ianthinogenes TaxID=122358 RepID=A0ABM7LKG3_9ACTN|nr:hypothetical protein Aiant_03000 [Actinoplanes ianthinogenes]GGR48377.1 hypothetical protein GCM10010168_79020 [Actinoplanes ianthinogenes]
MQVTDQALRALTLAAVSAHSRAETPVNSYHLLLGLTEAEGAARHLLAPDSPHPTSPAPGPDSESPDPREAETPVALEAGSGPQRSQAVGQEPGNGSGPQRPGVVGQEPESGSGSQRPGAVGQEPGSGSGVQRPGVVDRKSAVGPDRRRAGAADSPAAFRTAKEAVERAVVHARGSGRDYATTADLLFAILDLDSASNEGLDRGPVARALRVSGADPIALRAAATEQDHIACCQESGISPIRPTLIAMGSHAGRLPGRARTAAGFIAAAVPALLLWAAVLAVAWDTTGPETILAAGGLALAVFLALTLVARRRQFDRVRALVPDRLTVPAELQPVLDRLGLRSLEVRRQAGVALDRCFRYGPRALVVVCANTEAHAEFIGFVLWHELAHLARREHARRRLWYLLLIGLYVGATVGSDVRALAVAVLGGLVLTVSGRWWSELACDRFAVRHSGVAGLHAWVADQRKIRVIARQRGKWSAGKQLRSLLSHPPLRLRAALHPVTLPAREAVAA